MYRVVLTIVEVRESDFTAFLAQNSNGKADTYEHAIMRFISELDRRKEVKRIYQTAKVFKSYTDAKLCYAASLRDLNFDDTLSFQYFKVLQIEEYNARGMEFVRTAILRQVCELTGKGEEE